MRFIILLLVLVGCGGGTDSTSLRQPEFPRSTSMDRPVLEDDTLSVYVEEFYTIAEQKGVPTSKLVDSIIFVDSYNNPNTVGQCAQYDYGNKTIKRSVSILKSFWEKASPITQRSLIFHELGHCALSLPHKEQPGHIMSEYLISDKVALENWDILVDELFGTPPSNFANLVGTIESNRSLNFTEHNH